MCPPSHPSHRSESYVIVSTGGWKTGERIASTPLQLHTSLWELDILAPQHWWSVGVIHTTTAHRQWGPLRHTSQVVRDVSLSTSLFMVAWACLIGRWTDFASGYRVRVLYYLVGIHSISVDICYDFSLRTVTSLSLLLWFISGYLRLWLLMKI